MDPSIANDVLQTRASIQLSVAEVLGHPHYIPMLVLVVSTLAPIVARIHIR